MIWASNNFVNSFCMRGSSVGWNVLILCWKGLVPSLIGITCCIIRVSYVLRSLYVHAKTSRYFLNRRIKSCRSCGVQQVLRFTYFRSSFVPRCICSCHNVEFWVLLFTGPWKRFSRSYNFSSDNTPLWMRFPLLVLATSRRDYSCSSSSIAASFNMSVLSIKCSIYWS